METSTNETHNGWTNWHTFNAFNWFTSIQGTSHELDRIVYTYKSTRNAGYAIRRVFIRVWGNGHDGIKISKVNWQEIAESLVD